MGLLSIAVVTSTCAIFSALSPNYISLVLFRMVVGIGLGGGPYTRPGFSSLCLCKIGALGWLSFQLSGHLEKYSRLHWHGITVAHNILRKMAVINQKELPSGTLVCDQMTEPDEEFTPSKDAHFLSTGQKNISIYIRGFSSVLTLLSSNLWKTTLLLWVVYFCNTLSYYGVVLLTSELSSSQSICGLINLCSHKLIDSSIYINVFITSLAELPGLILAAVIVDKTGRRISMVLMYSFCFIFLLPLMFRTYKLLTTILLFGARMCVIGAFTVAGIYCPEMDTSSQISKIRSREQERLRGPLAKDSGKTKRIIAAH